MKKGTVLQWDGKVITKPGIYKGIPLDLYHSAELFGGVPAISSSGLRKIIMESPEDYWCESPYNPARPDPDEEQVKEKKHFVIGRALHHLVGGEKFFASQFVIRPEKIFDPNEKKQVPWNGNRTVCKEWLEKQRQIGKSVLSTTDAENLKGMALKMATHPAVRGGLLMGQVEYSYLWRDKETGIWLKWRPDNTPADLHFVDLKTTTDVRRAALTRTLADRAYYMQGALGRWACRELIGKELESFTLFFIKKTQPHSISLKPVKEVMLDKGEKLNRAALRLFWKCWTEKHWPGPGDDDDAAIEVSDREHALLDDKIQQFGL